MTKLELFAEMRKLLSEESSPYKAGILTQIRGLEHAIKQHDACVSGDAGESESPRPYPFSRVIMGAREEVPAGGG